MKRMFILALAILHLLTMTIFVTGCGDQKEIYRPIDDPGIDTTGTPPDGPPPDPPPPPDNLSGATDCLASSTVMSLEEITQKVLEGNYGSVLQRILADEISECVNQMGEEGVVLITSGNVTSNIIINEDSKGKIMFDSSYIADEIISGDYGSEAKEILSVFIRMSLKR